MNRSFSIYSLIGHQLHNKSSYLNIGKNVHRRRKTSPLNLVTSVHYSERSKMVRVLNVAEKNDAAKSLSEIMGRGRYQRREGFSKFNKIYEFDYNLMNQNVNMIMTSVSGHLLNYEFVGQYRKWHGCSPVALFDAPIQKECPQNYTDIKRTLEREVRSCQWLVIWTDGDREGENIGFEIIQVCTDVKPNIRVLRARFSEITPQAVQRACRNLLEPDKNVSDAVDVRQQLDLRIGAAFTRFQTLRLQKVFPATLAEQLVSYGSCQFPTLGFVVERFKQVEAFIPEPFWKIRVCHETEDGNVEFNWKRGRLFEHLPCLALYEHCLENPRATVTDVRTKPKSRWRPQALDTVELEKLASRKLRISAKETMRVAEKLYTQGFISYPRTETNQFPKDINLVDLVQTQVQDPRWGGFAAGILEDGGPRPRNGNKTDNAHPPIHPIKYTNNLQGNEQKVYEFVVRHFLACCSKDAQGQETTVEININDEKFTAAGLMIIAKNYLEVYIYDKWNAKVIPRFSPGESFVPKSIEMNQGETSPPSLLTEADLIALMDKHGIGTDATHAEHIETIKSRMYVGVREDGKFIPGELGMGLVDGYDAMGFEMSKPHLRAELEANLKLICEGRKRQDVVLQEQLQKYKEVFLEACNQAQKIDEALSQYFGAAQPFSEADMQVQTSEPVRPCPLCGQPMTLKSKKDNKGYFIGCAGYPQCRAVMWLPDSVLQVSVENTVCDRCQPGPMRHLKFKFKRGSVPAWIPLDYIGCIGGCDETLREVLDIRMPSGQTATQGNQRQNTGTQRPPGGNHGNPPPSQGTQGGYRVTQDGLANDSGYGSGTSSTFHGTQSQPSQRPARGALTPRNGLGFLQGSQPRGNRRSFGTHSAGDKENAVVCSCSEDAVLLTVRKEGPNTGRQFYKCSKPQGSGCDFFLWADDGGEGSNRNSSHDPGRPAWNNAPSRQRNNSYNSYDSFNNQRGSAENDSFGDSGSVQCGCGNPAKLLTVQKEGQNKGRQFYACTKPRSEGCNFFQWADEGGGAGSRNTAQPSWNNASSTQRNQHNTNFQNNSSNWPSTGNDTFGDGNDVHCGCGNPAKLLTVQKEGPNKGRQFYACTKPRNEGCKFFQWADEPPPDGGRGRGRGGFGDRGGSRQAGQPGPKRKVTCGECHQQGHTKRSCPQLKGNR